MKAISLNSAAFKSLCFILLILTNISCNKTEILPDPPIVIKPDMEILWSHKISSDSSIGFISAPILWNEDLIFSTLFFYPGNSIQSRNVKDGQLKWEQKDHLLGNEGTTEYNFTIYQNELIWENYNDFLNIDLGNGIITNHNRVIDAWMGPRITLFNNFIYTQISDKSIQQDNGFLVRREINGSYWDTLTTIQKEEGYTPFINMSNGYVSTPGDTMILFSVRKWNFQKSKGQTDFYCLSLKNRTIKWRLKDWDKDGASVLIPTIYNDQVYFQGHHTLYCVDIKSGQEKWRFAMPEYLQTLSRSVPLIAAGRLFIKSNDLPLFALDPDNGQVLWKNDDTGYETQKIHYAHGMIMFTSHHYLYVVNASTGKTIWKKKSPNDEGDVNFNGLVPIAINARDSIIYACDKQNIMAIKMPKLE